MAYLLYLNCLGCGFLKKHRVCVRMKSISTSDMRITHTTVGLIDYGDLARNKHLLWSFHPDVAWTLNTCTHCSINDYNPHKNSFQASCIQLGSELSISDPWITIHFVVLRQKTRWRSLPPLPVWAGQFYSARLGWCHQPMHFWGELNVFYSPPLLPVHLFILGKTLRAVEQGRELFNAPNTVMGLSTIAQFWGTNVPSTKASLEWKGSLRIPRTRGGDF